MPSSHRIHLIDASPYIFRGYFSLPTSITDKAGQPANAVFGFTDFLLKYVQEERPTHVGVAFDESLTTSFRNEIYPPYKAQRELPPAELEAQLKSCAEVARALGCATYVAERFEADDLIGTLCHQLTRKGQRVCVVSPDKDLAQLVGDHVELLDIYKDEAVTPSSLFGVEGIGPEHVRDVLALMGDTSDNVPGVPGIGPKTAARLIDEFGSLEEILAAAAPGGEPGSLTQKMRDKLEDHADDARLAQSLVRLQTALQLGLNLKDLRYSG